MFTIDPNADEPIMLLNKQIGPSYNEDGTPDGAPYVDGSLFQEELLWLDTMGKKRIQVWINSGGGSIVHAMNIFSAIVKSNTPVDTYNMGIAASSAGAVFMAGRKRYMCDYAQFMMHPVGGASDSKAADAFKESCVNMLSAKSDLTNQLVSYMMDITTWVGLDDCLKHGIATDAEYTKDNNRKYMPANNAKLMMAYSNNILTESLSNLKPIQMEFTKITNRLNLVDGANQEAILSAINQLDEAKVTAENRLAEAETKVSALQSELDAANAELEAAKAGAAEQAAETAAVDMVNTFKAKIGEDAAVLSKWVNKAKIDLEGTKELLESIPLNKINNRVSGGEPRPQGTSVQGIMNSIKNRIEGKK